MRLGEMGKLQHDLAALSIIPSGRDGEAAERTRRDSGEINTKKKRNRENPSSEMGKLQHDLAALSITPSGRIRSIFQEDEQDVSLSDTQLECVTSRGEVLRNSLVSRHASSDFVSRRYKLVHELGRGGFSYIKLVRDRKTGDERVCKVVSTEGMPALTLEITRKEIQTLCALDHPYVVKLYEYAEDTKLNYLILVLEYIAGGDCESLMKSSAGPVNEALVGQIMEKLLIAVSYCHARGIVHRDIKPGNIMLTSKAEPWGHPDIKLIDFGLAAHSENMSEFVGTAGYMAPELFSGADYTSKADIWSIGVTAIELLSGEAPFGRPETCNGDYDPVFQKIRSFSDFEVLTAELEDSTQWWGARSADAKDFARQLLVVDPDVRPAASEATLHPWFEMYRATPGHLTSDMIRSMLGYISAPPLVRCCLLVIAARTCVPNVHQIGAAFAGVDADGDGKASREELSEAVASTIGCWKVDDSEVTELLEALANEYGEGFIYTEFVAACLYGCYGTMDKLIERAFDALDDDRDGLVSLSEIRRLFRERDVRLLTHLPQERPFTVEEWRACLESTAEFHSWRPRRRRNQNASLLGFFINWFGCNGCENHRPAIRCLDLPMD